MADTKWISASGISPVNCSSSNVGGTHEEPGTDERSVYGLLSSELAPFSNFIRLAWKCMEREKMIFLRECKTKLLDYLSTIGEEGFSLRDQSSRPSKYFPAQVWYFFNIPEPRCIFGVLHGSAVSCLCLRCSSTSTNTWHVRCREPRNLKQTKAVKMYTREPTKESKTQLEEDKKNLHLQTAWKQSQTHCGTKKAS